MTQVLQRRLLEVIPVLIGITIASFAILQLVPGDPARIQLGPRATPAAVAELRQQLHLDDSVLAQYWHFVSHAVTFSFGDSYVARQPVSEVIGPRIVASGLLVAYSLVVAIGLALPLALVSAVGRDRWPDHGIRLVTTTTFAMPSFWIGLLLTLVVSLKLGWLPSSGYGETFGERVESLTLPAVTVALFMVAPLVRSLRTSLIDSLEAEYTEASRARGLSDRRVLLKHVLRNSVVSTVTLLSLFVGLLLSATVVVENVFSIPGLGSLLVSSVGSRDYPVIQTLTLLFGVTTVIVSLATDMLYTAIDPRVRL